MFAFKSVERQYIHSGVFFMKGIGALLFKRELTVFILISLASMLTLRAI